MLLLEYLNIYFCPPDSPPGSPLFQTSSIHSPSHIVHFLSWLAPSKLEQRGCLSSNFPVLLVLCLLPLPHCNWGSRRPGTASHVPQVPYHQRVPVSPSGPPLSQRALPPLIIPPQVGYSFYRFFLINQIELYCFQMSLSTSLVDCVFVLFQYLTWQTLKRRHPCVWWMS